MKYNKVMNLDEVCEYTGYHKKYLYHLVSKGILDASSPNGGKLFFDREVVERWMLSNPKNKTKQS